MDPTTKCGTTRSIYKYRNQRCSPTNVQTCFSAQALSHPADQVYNRGMNLCEPKFHKLRAQRVISLATCGIFRIFPEPSSARIHPSIVHSSFLSDGFCTAADRSPRFPRIPSRCTGSLAMQNSLPARSLDRGQQSNDSEDSGLGADCQRLQVRSIQLPVLVDTAPQSRGY